MAQKNRPFFLRREYENMLPENERVFPAARLYNSVKMRLVGVTTDLKSAFYVNDSGRWGLRIRVSGRHSLMNAKPAQPAPTKKSKLRYYIFRDAFGRHKFIYSHQAVFIAHSGAPIPDGLTIDHIDGNIENNSPENLRLVTHAINCRDGGFLIKLRNRNINPVRIQRPYLLRYFDRMAVIKPAVSKEKYYRLSCNDLQSILYMPKQDLQDYLLKLFNTQIEFAL